MGAVPEGLARRPDGRTRERRPVEAPRRPIEQHVLTEEPFASLHVPLDAYLANGSNYETVRLIALSDRYLGRDDDYEAIFAPRSRRSGASADVLQRRGRRLLAVPDAGADPGGIAPRAQTEPAPPPATFTRDGVVLPNPAATVLSMPSRTGSSGARRTTSTRARSTTRPSSGSDPKTQGATGSRLAGARVGCRAPSRSGQAWVTEILDRITPRFPRPPLWIAVGVVALLVATAARLADDPRAVGRRGRRARNPRRLAGRRARVRPPPLPALHRDRARRARG